MSKRQHQIQKSVQNIDLRTTTNHDYILQRDLAKNQVNSLLKRLKNAIRYETDQKIKDSLKHLLRELRSKYSIYLSKKIIDKFISISNGNLLTNSRCNFSHIEKEIKNTTLQICRRRYVVSKNKELQLTIKPSSRKCKRRNILNSATTIMSGIKMTKQLDCMFVKEKIFILKEFVSEEQFKKIYQEILQKIQNIDSQKFKEHTQKIKNYTVYDFIIQKIFSLIQEDSNNIAIRQKYCQAYKKMKEEMVAIVTNEQQVHKLIRDTLNSPHQMPTINKHFYKTSKKNYFQLEKEKHDISSQIEETLQAAKKVISDAFIKQGRPDYAYEMGLALENRTTPFIQSRSKF